MDLKKLACVCCENAFDAQPDHRGNPSLYVCDGCIEAVSIPRQEAHHAALREAWAVCNARGGKT